MKKSDTKLLCRVKKDESREGLAHPHGDLKDTCSLHGKLHLALSDREILFLLMAQWEFPLQQPMKCYCIIIHLRRPIRTYQQSKKFNLNSPFCAKE